MAEKKKLLLVEDETITAMSLRASLERLGYEVSETVVTGYEAVQKAFSYKPSVILMDINLIGEMNGVEAVEKIHEKNPIPVIYITGYSNREIKERALRTRPLAYLEKPVNVSDIQALLESGAGITAT
ncbi:MAG TPA: response regulator [Spirochaetota bacterium]|nr:response regulator [Spirochaetota bacterium]HPI90138.1 response regulator [Spirochaetota bacterium]HPR49146.1 response regulator [Spirochaetota bacterium]